MSTKAFNQAVKRNAARFPADFAFQLTPEEASSLRSQNVTTDPETAGDKGVTINAISPSGSFSARHRRVVHRPWVFTEHGAVMAANVLRSARAMEMSVYVVRAFIMQREALATNAVIMKRLAEIDKSLLEHDAALQVLWRKLQPLLQSPPDKPSKEVGYHTTMKR